MNGRIDFEEVKRQVDLLSLAGSLTTLGSRPTAATGGGEWAGPCPKCGGRDRFRVQPYRQPYPVWLCRSCTDGKWQDVIELGKLAWPGLSIIEVCERLVGGKLPTTTMPRPKTLPAPAAIPPAADWQRAARQVIAETQAALWEPRSKPVRDYLHGRGLADETIKRFGLGYNATGSREKYGRYIAGLWVPRGIVIPCELKDEVWYLKIRLLPGVPALCQDCKQRMDGAGKCPNCGKDNRYTGVKGNRTAAIFNAEDLTPGYPALFLEGEFDVMLAWQYARDLLPAATIGAATNQPDLATWGRYFEAPSKTLILPDNDVAGERFAKTMAENSRFPIFVGLPGKFKDLGEFHRAGSDVPEWIAAQLDAYDPLPKHDILSLAAELGATVTELKPEPAR